MSEPIRFYLDFASPYSYFALAPLQKLALAHGRPLELRPILLWAVFKQQGVENPLGKPARRDYFLQDVARSAAFFDVPFRIPEPLQISAHLAARLFHARTAVASEVGPALAAEIFESFFVKGHDITKPEVLAALPSLAGLPADTVREMIEGATGRERLAAAIDEASTAGVIGVPFVTLDGESFFGADRLPQIAWRLERQHSTAGTAARP
ncbi:2-hydroxychromene-2-carboxylate isomerase [Hyphomicrobiales bacterium]|nr:2-hydroxychromene-2-carboxylate isomerase [Hyphomicrobiales bacterium]CAH1700536.1 2-hydroxychromene-2-carboxylate isomerase [Hyphomicrobiales bacterium]CAI0344385.1 2-hydroxychromene-2-carboxylate isomerase [Hyphomicrobiales bacterium]